MPLTGPRPVALVPIALLTAVAALVAVDLAGRRDLGSGLVADRDRARARLGLLAGPVGLTVRLVRPTVLAWWGAIALAGLLYGLVARSAGSTVSGSSVHEVFSRLGVTGTGTETVLGICFLVLAVLVAFVGAGQLTAARGEESSGRLENLLTRPLSAAAWLGGRLGVAVVVLVVAGLLGGLAAWLGAASQHAGVRIGTVTLAGINLVPPALVILGSVCWSSAWSPGPRRRSSTATWPGRSSSSSSAASGPPTTGSSTPRSSTRCPPPPRYRWTGRRTAGDALADRRRLRCPPAGVAALRRRDLAGGLTADRRPMAGDHRRGR